jgi:hypothetical protein
MSRTDNITSMRVSEATRRLNPELFAGGMPIIRDAQRKASALKNPSVILETIPAGKKRLRQSDAPIMNKLETRFFEERLTPDYVKRDERVLIQAVRLELGRGIWYKPDFFLPATIMRQAIAYEVKGPKVFRGGFENLKVAARVHPWVKFYLVWENREKGIWERQEILP